MWHSMLRVTLCCVALALSLPALPLKVWATEPTLDFIGVKDGFGVKQIKAEGVPLLVDDAAGFYLICSGSGVDDTNNIASFVADNNGTLRSMNGAKQVSLPYSFKLQPDAKNLRRLTFEIVLGPAPIKLATVSMPVDGRRQVFDRLRYDGERTVWQYADNAAGYTPPGRGQYNIRTATGHPKWGEMIGSDYTVRVTITNSSRPLSLSFVDAPSLSTGVRNVEFGFGSFATGDRATASGYLEIEKTDPRVLR
jgi:hypothetical protein